MKKILLLILPVILTAQDVKIGNWKNYLAYNSASYIAESNSNIYCIANGSLYYLNKSDESVSRMSKVNGLSDVDLNKASYSSDLNLLIITYNNCNIDIVSNNEIINISDIKRKEIAGLKEINNIILKDSIAYLSTSMGLILVDLEKKEIKDTYRIRESSEGVYVNSCCFIGDTIVVATNNGLYFANENISNLSDYSSWGRLNNAYNDYDDIVYNNGNLFIDSLNEVVSISVNQNIIVTSYRDSVCINNNCIKDVRFENIKYGLIDNDLNVWVADSINGLLKFKNNSYQTSYVPEGPIINNLFNIEYLNDKLYLCHGGHTNYSSNLGLKSGVSIKNVFDEWTNYDRYDLDDSKDILSVAEKNNIQYYASWKDGIIAMEEGDLVEKYNFYNTNGALDTTYYSSGRIRVSDLKFDLNGNLWGLSSEVNNPLFVKTQDDNWFSFSMNQDRVGLFFDKLIIDSHNQKWGVIARGGGVFVYDDNNTISNAADDRFKILNTNIGFGGLPSMWVYSIEEDLEGAIWIGTDKGIGIIYNPSYVFSNYNFDAQQVLIQDGDYGQYLLSEEKIKCIKIDQANRKWIGTEKSGVFLVSDDGLEQILHFTSKNSPLLSNNIIDIAINHKNGEVFFGTEKGIISYRSDATTAQEIQSETHVFPNPVRENYNGPIAINGLVRNANIKITDTDGNLIFDGYANGGQAIWNGKNKNNVRVSTGVYLVFSSDETGKEKIVSKILVIN